MGQDLEELVQTPAVKDEDTETHSVQVSTGLSFPPCLTTPRAGCPWFSLPHHPLVFQLQFPFCCYFFFFWGETEVEPDSLGYY